MQSNRSKCNRSLSPKYRSGLRSPPFRGIFHISDEGSKICAVVSKIDNYLSKASINGDGYLLRYLNSVDSLSFMELTSKSFSYVMNIHIVGHGLNCLLQWRMMGSCCMYFV